MASCIGNVRTKTYQNWITFLQVMMKKHFSVFMSHSVVVLKYSLVRWQSSADG